MAKNRYINTKFWDDSYILTLTASEKFLFLYFLTSPLTKVSGVYEISLKRIAFDTGLDEAKVSSYLEKFSQDQKIFYFDGWIVIKNFIKNQSLNENMKKGIKNELESVPEEILLRIAENETLSNAFKSFDISKYKLKPKSKLKPKPQVASGEVSEKQKRDDQLLIEYYFGLKGWLEKSQKELNAVFPRYVKTAKQILELTDLETAKAKMLKLKTWADNNDLDWSLETMIKKWLELDDLPQEKTKKATIDGDRAYQKNGDWWVITRDGEHKKYIGSLSKLSYG